MLIYSFYFFVLQMNRRKVFVTIPVEKFNESAVYIYFFFGLLGKHFTRTFWRQRRCILNQIHWYIRLQFSVHISFHFWETSIVKKAHHHDNAKERKRTNLIERSDLISDVHWLLINYSSWQCVYYIFFRTSITFRSPWIYVFIKFMYIK